jgi:SOS-response transcriptional repressor LexA
MNTIGICVQQQAVLDLSRDFRADKGVAPSPWKIQNQFRFGGSRATHERLQTLVKKGEIQRSGVAARSMTMTGVVPIPCVHTPLLDIIPAGYPSDQEQQSDRCPSIDEETLQLPKNGRTFALGVRAAT